MKYASKGAPSPLAKTSNIVNELVAKLSGNNSKLVSGAIFTLAVSKNANVFTSALQTMKPHMVTVLPTTAYLPR